MTVLNIPLVAQLTESQQMLWEQLATFRFDAEFAEKPFSVRLAAENGWTPQFTQRALDEYRRFLFLTQVAGHVVCPSEEVDAVWHQHLTYSRSYWNDLCRDTLGGPLHHEPTQGGRDQRQHHWMLYQQTLASYRRMFGEEPPRDLWPLAFERFDRQSQPRQINLRDHWVLKKPAWWPRRLSRPTGAGIMVLPVAAMGLGPFDWTGVQFLMLYSMLYLGCLIWSLIYRRAQRDVPVSSDENLSPEAVACLSFGRPAAVNATVAGMLHMQQLVSKTAKGLFGSTNGAKVTFTAGETPPDKAHALASAIYRATQADELTLLQLQTAVDAETQVLEEKLVSHGYLVDTSRNWAARFKPALVMQVLFAFGLCKLLIGISRERPVGVLAGMLVITVITALAMLVSIRRSIAGDRYLEALKTQHDDLRSGMLFPSASVEKVVLGSALFGAAALEGTVFDDLKSAWKTSAGAGGGDGGSGCGGGAGGCGGGGGGCGGGGCGGCGS